MISVWLYLVHSAPRSCLNSGVAKRPPLGGVCRYVWGLPFPVRVSEPTREMSVVELKSLVGVLWEGPHTCDTSVSDFQGLWCLFNLEIQIFYFWNALCKRTFEYIFFHFHYFLFPLYDFFSSIYFLNFTGSFFINFSYPKLLCHVKLILL